MDTEQAFDFDAFQLRYIRLSQGDLDETLNKTRAEMIPALTEQSRLIRNCGALIVGIAQATQSAVQLNTQSRLVCNHLLARLANDLLALHLLAQGAFAMQAMSLAAALYETALTIAAIGSDEDLAKRWIYHEDTGRTILSIKQMAERAEARTGKHLGLYGIYSGLCIYKHINPVAQRDANYIECSLHGGRAFAAFPVGGAYEKYRCRQSIEVSCLISWVALSTYAIEHTPNSLRLEFVPPMDEIYIRCNELIQKTVEDYNNSKGIVGMPNK